MNISDLTVLLKNSLSAIAVTAALTLSAGSAAQEYTVNLKDTDIQEFIKFVADVTGTTMVVDPNVKGKVRVISSRPCLLYTSPSPRDRQKSRMPSSA